MMDCKTLLVLCVLGTLCWIVVGVGVWLAL